MNMMEVANCIYEIGATGSRLDKERLLKNYADVPGFKEVLRHIFNPLVTTGISQAKLDSAIVNMEYMPNLDAVLAHFSVTRTGSAADVHIATSFIAAQKTESARALANAIVTKELKIGVTETTLNKVYGKGFIPIIECMLGVEYSKAGTKKGAVYISSRKIDGVRRILIKKNGVVSMFSRNGLPDEGLVEIEQTAVALLPDNTVYDGELEAIIEGPATNLDLRQKTNSLANRKGVRTGLTFNVFDSIPLDEFEAGESKYDLMTRKIYIAMLFNDEVSLRLFNAYNMLPEERRVPANPFIKPVEIVCVSNNMREHEDAFRKLIDAGEEGLMMILASSKYVPGKRSKDWVKMKRFESIDVPIVGFQEGNGRLAGTLGAVLINYKGATVNVGSGFSDAERKEIWENLMLYKGNIIEVMHQGESKNQAGGVSLNCPIFKGFRYDKQKKTL